MKKQKNNNSTPKRNRKVPVVGGLFILFAVIFLAIFIFLGYIWNVVKYSNIFTVREVQVKDCPSADLSYLKGRNIFGIDLKKESQDIIRSNPNYSGVSLVRVFPSRIVVQFIERKPVALIKLYRYFAIDEAGAIFYIQGEQLPELDLPVITGLETRLFGPKPGVRYNIKELNLALEILREAKRTHILRYYKIRRVDVGNAANSSIFIPIAQNTMNDLEVKLGSNDITNKMAILAGLIINGKNDISGIKYIDLRFNEPVIKLQKD